MTTNPFEAKKYFIYESLYSTKCNKNTFFSSVSSANIPKNKITNRYKKTGPFNLLEIQQYLMKELSKFLITIKIVDNCERNSELGECAATFKNFSKEYLENVKKGLLSDQSTMPFGNYAYTDSYFNSKTNTNDKKSLCQRYGDLGNMLMYFQKIVASIDTPAQKKLYSDEFERLVKEFNENNKLRAQLESKLDNLIQGYAIKDSTKMLDSTIYIGVLWTILATTTVYYIFKKM